jgi:DNA polymerase-1
LLAHFSKDKLLVEAFRRGDDIHTLTASQVFGVPPLMVTPDRPATGEGGEFRDCLWFVGVWFVAAVGH